MAIRNREKKEKKFTFSMKRTLLVFFVLIIVCLIGLMVRVSFLQHSEGDSYTKIVLSQQEYNSETIPYRRGDIVDCRGTVLATSTDVYSLILDCKVLCARESYMEPTLLALFSCFPELDQDEVKTIIKDKPNSQYNVLLKQLPYDRMKAFVDMQSEDARIKGIWFEKSYVRSYPYSTLASSIIGFITPDGSGVNGIENYYDSALSGINGRKYGYLNSDNDLEKTVKDAKDGQTVVLTIDANLQSIVEQKIKEFNDTYTGIYRPGEAGADHIGVVIMNPKTGQVKAMANYPNYDLTNPRDLSAYYSEDELDRMTDEETLDALNRLWQNFCVSYTYEPGSTAKPFTVACGLETGTLAGDEVYECDGFEEISNHTIHCVNIYGHGMETVEKSLMDSCNDALMQMSYAIGKDNFTTYQKIFGFGLKTNIDLPGEARTDSLVYTADTMKTVDLATNSFGQNFNTTMIQLAGAFCSLVNDGEYCQPHIVARTVDSDGNTVISNDGQVIKQTVSSETSKQIRGYLENVVAAGTGKYAKVPGYSMGGKTGTAEISVAGGKDVDNYLVSFIGFLPSDDPELVIYAVIEKPNVWDQAHSVFAQNLVREILEEALPYLNMFPDEPVASDAPTNEETTLTWAVEDIIEHDKMPVEIIDTVPDLGIDGDDDDLEGDLDGSEWNAD